MNQIGNLLQQYSGGGQAPPTVHQDYDRVAQAAPESVLAGAISSVFRSDQTPPFSQLAGQLFGQSDSHQRAGLLNTLLAAAGPALISQVLNNQGASALAGQFLGGQAQVTPQQADQFSPEMVQEIAGHAERMDPSVVDALGGFYAQHPDVVKSLGGAALNTLLSSIGR